MNLLWLIAVFFVSIWSSHVPGGAAIKTRAAGFAEELATTRMCFVAGTLVLVQVNGVEALLPIETLQPLARDGAKINAWAKCEHTGVEDWRPIVAYFTTHPEELFDLTIDTSGDGQADETLTGTGEHPFWVEAFAAFMPMRELAPGMRLTTARSSGQATIVGNTSKRGPPGERFITYNFEVAEFHTYFGKWGQGANLDQLVSPFFFRALDQFKIPDKKQKKRLTREMGSGKWGQGNGVREMGSGWNGTVLSGLSARRS